jgi:PAS domain S-box-containing protein
MMNPNTPTETYKYLAIFEDLHEPVILLDRENRVENTNQAWTEIFGALAGPGNRYHHNDDAESQISWLSEDLAVFVAGQQETHSFEKVVDTPQGRRNFHVKIKAMRDGSHHVNNTLIMLNDITGRKQKEDLLREQERQFRILYERIHTVILLIDPQTDAIVEANPAACTYYGYPYQTLTNMKITEIDTHPNTEQLVKIQRAETDKRNDDHFRHRLASGSIRDVDVYNSPITVGGKSLICSIIHDVVVHKQLEKTLCESEKLQGVLEMAGAVCHEMNQPLMAISGYSELLTMNHPGNNPLSELISKIKAQVYRLGEISHKLMGITRYETKNYLESKIIDIDRAIE